MSIVIAWHTTDDLYTGLAHQLKFQLDAVNQRSHFYPIAPVGDWRANILHSKAKLVVRAMDQFPGEQLLFLDVDAHVRGPLDYLFSSLERCDAAFAFRYKREWGSRLHISGRVYLFNPTDEARGLAQQWVAQCKSGLAKKEEEAIAQVLGNQPIAATIGYIPPQYACYEIGTEPAGAILVHKSIHARAHSWPKRLEQAARRQYRALRGTRAA